MMIELHQINLRIKVLFTIIVAYRCIVHYKRISKHTPIPKVISLIVVSRRQQLGQLVYAGHPSLQFV